MDRDDCSTSDECREAFGMGYVCASDGLCDRAETPARVVLTYPDDLLENPSAYGERVVLGVIIDNSVETHRMRADAVLMAAEGANDPSPPGLELSNDSHREIGVIVATNESDFMNDGLEQDQASAELGRQLVDIYGVRSIIGPPSSSSTEAVYESLAGRADDERPVVISMSATSNSLTGLEFEYDMVMGDDPSDAMPGLLWRTAPPDAGQAARILQSFSARGITVLGIAYEDGPYGLGLADAVEAGFGGTVTREVFSSPLSRDQALGDLGADVSIQEVLFVSSQTTDAKAAVVFAGTPGNYVGKTLFLTDAAANSDLLDGIGGASAYFSEVRGTRPAAPSGSVYNTFASSFNTRRTGSEGSADSYSFIAHAHDAAWLAIYGSNWALTQESAFTGRTVARGLRRVGDSGGIDVDVGVGDWEEIRDAIEAGLPFDVTGASGDLDYDPDTEETTGVVEGWCIRDGGAGEDFIETCDVDLLSP